MGAITNGWTDSHDAMTMAIKTRQKLIEELAEENFELKRELGYYRSALKLVRFSVKRHLGIDLF